MRGKGTERYIRLGEGVQSRLSFFSLLYGTPAPSAESQQPEAWTASIYGHLGGVSLNLPSIIFDIYLKLNP